MKDINKELTIRDGDFDLCDEPITLNQTCDIIINSDKGQVMNKLWLGVGIGKYLNGPLNQIQINNDISAELKKEDIILTNLQVANNEIVVKAKYK